MFRRRCCGRISYKHTQGGAREEMLLFTRELRLQNIFAKYGHGFEKLYSLSGWLHVAAFRHTGVSNRSLCVFSLCVIFNDIAHSHSLIRHHHYVSVIIGYTCFSFPLSFCKPILLRPSPDPKLLPPRPTHCLGSTLVQK